MPDDIARECRDGERVDSQSQAMHGYQSAWMAHWRHTSCKSGTPAHNSSSVDCELKEVKDDSEAEQHDLPGGSDVAMDMHDGALGEARVEADPGTSRKASFDSKSFPIFNLSKKTDGVLSLKRETNSLCQGEDKKSESEASSGDDDVHLNRTGSHLPSTSAHAPPKEETLVGECQLVSQGSSPTAFLMKSSHAAEQDNLAVSTSLWNDFVKSASDIGSNGRDKGKTLMSPFTRGQHEMYPSSSNLASQERFTSTKYQSYSSLLIHEKKVCSLSDPRRSSISRWIEGGISHLPHDPIAGSDDELYFVRGQHQQIQNYTANANITNKTAFLESTKPQNFYGGSSIIAQFPCSVHDVETMKIYTSIDSAENASRRHPQISQTTHHFLMSKKTDVNLSKRGQFFGESIAPTKFKGNAFNEIIDLSSPMSDRALEGVKLETRGSSINSEGKENVQDFISPPKLKNESSAETDAMDINALHENHLPGEVPLQTNKCSKDSQSSPTSQVAIISASEKTKAKSVNTTLPDINQEPRELLTLASPVVDRETSTSRTHSLDVEHLLSHANEHARSISGNSSLGPDPSSRWVKRLKLCTLGSAYGTKSANGETSSREKVNNIFKKIVKGRKSSLEPKMLYHAEGQRVPDLPGTASTNGKASFTEAKRTVEITLSHPWIQRWSHNRAASSQRKLELVELRDPKSSNTALDFQKKQFPSIAAMALMGKAMNSLNPSELMKKGPVIVWNTKGF